MYYYRPLNTAFFFELVFKNNSFNNYYNIICVYISNKIVTLYLGLLRYKICTYNIIYYSCYVVRIIKYKYKYLKTKVDCTQVYAIIILCIVDTYIIHIGKGRTNKGKCTHNNIIKRVMNAFHVFCQEKCILKINNFRNNYSDVYVLRLLK